MVTMAELVRDDAYLRGRWVWEEFPGEVNVRARLSWWTVFVQGRHEAVARALYEELCGRLPIGVLCRVHTTVLPARWPFSWMVYDVVDHDRWVRGE